VHRYNQNIGSHEALWWESADIALGAHRTFALMAGATTVMPGVGFGSVMSARGQVIAHSDSTQLASYNSTTGFSGLVYGSINGSLWTTDANGSPNSEFSWDILGQMKEGFVRLLPTVSVFDPTLRVG
jgi:hypothetical protein